MLSPTEIGAVEQRLASLKKQQGDLLVLFSESHASVEKANEIELKLLEVAAQIAELETAMKPPLAKTG